MPDLAQHRSAFLAQLSRMCSDPREVERLEAVLEHFLEWSAARASQLEHHKKKYEQNVVSFARPDGTVFWSAYPRDDGYAKFEILPRMRRALPAAALEDAVTVLNRISKEPVTHATTLRVPFLALKNSSSRNAVTELLDRLVAVPLTRARDRAV
jgi:hypothetical protein